MTYLERSRARLNVAPLLVALAIASSFAAGIVIGGPVLNLSMQATPWSASQQLLEKGRTWELERAQQAVQGTIHATANERVRAGGAAWEAERRQVIPRNR
ncbi:MAG: hypothetical protein ABI622_11490 [Chloroflexota bacterium]